MGEVGAELPDARAVRPAAAADVDVVADLKHVAAVERARRLDPSDVQPELADRLLGARDSGRRSAAPGRASTATSPHTTIVSSMNAESGSSSAAGASRIFQPAPASASTYARVLLRGQLGVDRRALEVGDDAVAHPGARRPHEGDAL